MNGGGKEGIPNWIYWNANLRITDKDGRTGVLQIRDGGQWTEIYQEATTVAGTEYVVTFDVWTNKDWTEYGDNRCENGKNTGGLLIIDGSYERPSGTGNRPNWGNEKWAGIKGICTTSNPERLPYTAH